MELTSDTEQSSVLDYDTGNGRGTDCKESLKLPHYDIANFNDLVISTNNFPTNANLVRIGEIDNYIGDSQVNEADATSCTP